MTVGVGGTPKIQMNSEERDYRQRLRQAKVQADGNPYVAGVQEGFERGLATGDVVKDSRQQRGDVTLKPQSLLNPNGNFAYKDSSINAPLDDARNQTASLGLFDATGNPNRDPQELADKKLQERLDMYAKAGSNAGFGNNDRSQTMRLG